MQRALGVVLVVFAVGCRIGFDPVDDDPDDGDEVQIGSGAPLTAKPGSDFYTVCTPGRPCAVDCVAASSCVVECNGASSCDVECSQAQCFVEQCVEPACSVDCGQGTKVSFANNVACD